MYLNFDKPGSIKDTVVLAFYGHSFIFFPRGKTEKIDLTIGKS